MGIILISWSSRCIHIKYKSCGDLTNLGFVEEGKVRRIFLGDLDALFRHNNTCNDFHQEEKYVEARNGTYCHCVGQHLQTKSRYIHSYIIHI